MNRPHRTRCAAHGRRLSLRCSKHPTIGLPTPQNIPTNLAIQFETNPSLRNHTFVATSRPHHHPTPVVTAPSSPTVTTPRPNTSTTIHPRRHSDPERSRRGRIPALAVAVAVALALALAVALPLTPAVAIAIALAIALALALAVAVALAVTTFFRRVSS